MQRELKITNIRNLLNNYREENNWSIPTLAQKIGMNDSSLQIILSGKRDITLEMVHFSYYTFGEETLKSLISNEKEDKMIKEYLNPITRNEERLIIRKYCRENNITIEQIAKDHGVTPSVLSRTITREFSANFQYYQILKNIGLTEELEDILLERKELISELKKLKSHSKEEALFLYNTLILEKVLSSDEPFKIIPRKIKEKVPATRNKIGKIGAALRQKHGLSFQDMANLLNCSPSTIQSMEASKIPFNIDYYNLLIEYGYQAELEQEIENLKKEILLLKGKEEFTKKERNQIKSYRNFFDKNKLPSNKRSVKAKSIINAIIESKIIKSLSDKTSVEIVCKEMGIAISSLHKILQGKQIANEKFYHFLVEKGYKEELKKMLEERTARFSQIQQKVEQNEIIYYKNLKESNKQFKQNSLESFTIHGTLNVKDILSFEDYIFYKSYISLRKSLNS